MTVNECIIRLSLVHIYSCTTLNQKIKLNSVQKSKHVTALKILKLMQMFHLYITRYTHRQDILIGKATTLVMMQVLLLIMKDYKHATVLIIIMFPY